MKSVFSTLLMCALLNFSMASAQIDQSVATVASSTKTCEESRASGEATADLQHSSAGWWVGGLASGFLLGLIGTGVVWGISFASSPQPDRIPEGVHEDCFRRGYKAEAKGANKVGAGVGGLLGTLAMVLVIVSANSGN